MRVLVLGGTRFVGRHLVDALLARGHQVTLCNRGRSRPDLFPDVERIVADRNDDLLPLAERRWDAVIDTSAYVPAQVERLADALTGGEHIVLVSTISVYDDPPAGFREDAALVAPIVDAQDVTPETYGGLKVACERAARRRFGADRLLVVRPGFLVGPDDHTWRFPYWVARISDGGEVLAPAPGENPLQVLDARDLASFVVGALDHRAGGEVHVAGPSSTFADVLACVGEVTRSDANLRWVDQAELAARGITLPLAIPPDGPVGAMAADLSRATGMGLAHRPLSDTVADTLEWARDPHVPPPDGIGPDRATEARLLAELADRPAPDDPPGAAHG